MRRIFVVSLIAAFFGLTALSSAAVTVTPFSDPNTPVLQGTPLATLFTNTDSSSVAVDFNMNINYGGPSLQVSDGSKCVYTYIKRGTSRYRCQIPANGEVLFTQAAQSVTTYHTAYSTPTGANGAGVTVLASVAYLTIPKPVVYYTPPITCKYKGWGYYVAPAGCPTP